MNTPYYLIRKDVLDNGIRQLKSALDTFWGNTPENLKLILEPGTSLVSAPIDYVTMLL